MIAEQEPTDKRPLVCVVAGARPNFPKVAPVISALRGYDINVLFVHTGQHYDPNLSGSLLDELNLEPDIRLQDWENSKSRGHDDIRRQLAEVFEKHKPDLVLVPGDVDSSRVAAEVAAEHNIPIGHIEAGLRCGDSDMPEERNRVIIDHLSELLFTTTEEATQNLIREGVDPVRIHFVGNTMIDTLLLNLGQALERRPWETFGVEPKEYALFTLHRRENLASPDILRRLVAVVSEIAKSIPVIFPCHPNTRNRLSTWNIDVGEPIKMCEPLPYLTFLGLMAEAKIVLSDSAGVQEETTMLRIPCLTLRNRTERPITLTTELGTSRLVGTDPAVILQAAKEVMTGQWPLGGV